MSNPINSAEIDAEVQAALQEIDRQYQQFPHDHPSHPLNINLLNAVRRSDLEGVRTAIANGARVRKLPGILEEAITGDVQDIRILTFLLQKGARDIPKGGVLTKAAVSGRVDILHYLLRRGFTPAVGLQDGEAERYGVQGVEGIEGLANTLVAATLARQTEAVMMLLEFGKVRGKVIYPFEVWKKAVMIAEQNEDKETVKALLDAEEKIYGSRVYLKVKEFVNSTPAPAHRTMQPPKSILKNGVASPGFNPNTKIAMPFFKKSSVAAANINSTATAANGNSHKNADDHTADVNDPECRTQRIKARIAARQQMMKENEDPANWVVVAPGGGEGAEGDFVVVGDADDDEKDDFVLV
ncbi:hypothetical protein BZA77DRAFT_293093 [Pyronema omphalodes]|nr:hypothetical protein BZA77DRAFT_293093 [Pyronema omphalodes]